VYDAEVTNVFAGCRSHLVMLAQVMYHCTGQIGFGRA
jgi:hypothetical protein